MTPRQKEVLDFIRRYRGQYGISPTIEEIGEDLKLSKTSIHEHMTQLFKDGHLLKEGRSRQPRAFRPVGEEAILRESAIKVVDDAMKNKGPDDKVGRLHKTITEGLRALPSQD
jgi:SOS-response transcriptional repressor LexA